MVKKVKKKLSKAQNALIEFRHGQIDIDTLTKVSQFKMCDCKKGKLLIAKIYLRFKCHKIMIFFDFFDRNFPLTFLFIIPDLFKLIVLFVNCI